eukprot:PITA_30528
MGAFSLLSSWIDAATTPKPKKKFKQFQTMELRVIMDYEGCERKVKNTLTSMKGVSTVEVERKHNKVMIYGYVDPKKVLKRARGTGKTAEVWPYKPCHLVYYPYSVQVYDKKAPSGYVRSVDPALSYYPDDSNNAYETYTSLFSEDNPNACTIM